MSVIIVDAKPGFGKTLSMSWFCLDNFKRKNPPLKVWFTEHILRKPYIYDLSEYSDFPILLKDKKRNGKPYFYKDINGNILSSDKLYTLSFRIFLLYFVNIEISTRKKIMTTKQIKYSKRKSI